MPIRPPAGAEIRPLVAALDSDDAVARESAVARLSLIAPRGVDALLRENETASPRERAGILRALETDAYPSALPIAQQRSIPRTPTSSSRPSRRSARS
jgi:hypothetical protein